METFVLFRPAGSEDLRLIEASGFTACPPRLPEQPIFYPVLNEEYARQIARDWNVRDSGTGYVTRFLVRTEFLGRYAPQTVGAAIHRFVRGNGGIVGERGEIHDFVVVESEAAADLAEPFVGGRTGGGAAEAGAVVIDTEAAGGDNQPGREAGRPVGAKGAKAAKVVFTDAFEHVGVAIHHGIVPAAEGIGDLEKEGTIGGDKPLPRQLPGRVVRGGEEAREFGRVGAGHGSGRLGGSGEARMCHRGHSE